MPPANPLPLISTTTGEIYLPTRLVYAVDEPEALRNALDRHKSFSWDPTLKRWTWNYDRLARKLGFPPEYDEAMRRQGGLVLASCFLLGKTLHVYTRCGLRAAKFLAFFDKQVNRSVAMGQFVDEYNLITVGRDLASIPTPEDIFRDESRIEFFDIATLMDEAKTPEQKQALAAMLHGRTESETLVPLERHRLELFYADGPTAFELAMRHRDTMAMLQHKSNKPIRPFEVIRRMLEKPH